MICAEGLRTEGKKRLGTCLQSGNLQLFKFREMKPEMSIRIEIISRIIPP